jgi:hypothetical protein
MAAAGLDAVRTRASDDEARAKWQLPRRPWVLQDGLAKPAAWSTPESSAASAARHEAAKRAVEQLCECYEQVGG